MYLYSSNFRTMTADQLADTPIADLPVSHSFYLQSAELGFRTIREIMQVPVKKLLEREGFSYRWFAELLRLLKRYKALGLLVQQ
jgi:hypothetical protein